MEELSCPSRSPAATTLLGRCIHREREERPDTQELFHLVTARGVSASAQYGYNSGGSHSTSSGPNFRWWIPASGIRRDVIQADIQRYLGPESVVRPGEGLNNDRVRPLMSSLTYW